MSAGDFKWTEWDKQRTISGGIDNKKELKETRFVDYFPFKSEEEADRAIARLEAVVTRANNIVKAESRPFKEGDIQATKVLSDSSNLPNLNYDVFPEVDSNDLFPDLLRTSTESNPKSIIKVNYKEFLELKDLVNKQGEHILLLGRAIIQLQNELLEEMKKSRELRRKAKNLDKNLARLQAKTARHLQGHWDKNLGIPSREASEL